MLGVRGRVTAAERRKRHPHDVARSSAPANFSTFSLVVRKAHSDAKTSSSPRSFPSLAERLARHGMVEVDIPRSFSNACQYDAVFHQYRQTTHRSETIQDAASLKRASIEWIADNLEESFNGATVREWIEGMGYSSPTRYVAHMSKGGVRGDAITLVAMSRVLRANVIMYKHRQATTRIKTPDATRTLVIGYYPEVHYVSTAPSS